MQRSSSLLLTAAQMQQVDAKAVEQGINSFKLMCAAGKAVSDVAEELLQELIGDRSAVSSSAPSIPPSIPSSTARPAEHAPRILIVAGPGNNGGDGAIAATELSKRGYAVTVLRCVTRTMIDSCLSDSTDSTRSISAGKLSSVDTGETLTMTDADRAFARWTGPLHEIASNESELDHACRQMIEQADVIIDALLGAGLSRPLEGTLSTLVSCMNESKARIVSVDVPSGLNGNTHQVDGACVQADVSVTFFRFKPAHFLYPGAALCGIKRLIQIGLSDAQLNPDWPECVLNEPAAFSELLPVPSIQGHKFDRGHVLVRSGPLMSTGAARLSAQTALECGAGLVTLSSDQTALPVNAAHLTAVMIKPCDSASDWQALLHDSRINTVVVGPGNGVDAGTRDAVKASLKADKHCILDADALSCWPAESDRQHLFGLLAACANTAVLTPHQGEFARLFPTLHAQSGLSKLHAALAAAEMCSAVVVLKGADTVIASPDGRSAINASAPPWLATAGAGDVLAGVIASLVAQGMPGFEAACAAVWLHGEAARQLGYPMTAEKLVIQLPSVLHETCYSANAPSKEQN